MPAMVSTVMQTLLLHIPVAFALPSFPLPAMPTAASGENHTGGSGSAPALLAAGTPLHIPLQRQTIPILSRNNVTIGHRTTYFGDIAVGGPRRQVFSVVFDTGSGSLILPDADCESQSCQTHRRYDRQMSAMAVDVDHDGTPVSPTASSRDTLELGYGSGEATGEFVLDHVCLRRDALNCVQLQLIAADRMSEEPFVDLAADGVFGLGMEELSLHPNFNFLHQLQKQNPGMLPRFAIFFALHDDGQSVISFGGHSEEYVGTPLQWVPVDYPESGFWSLKINRIRIGDTIVDECTKGGCAAILDTGLSLLGVPKDLVAATTQLLSRPVPDDLGTDLGSIDCVGLPGPTLHFDLDGHTISLTAQDYTRPRPYNITRRGSDKAWELYCRADMLPRGINGLPGSDEATRTFVWGKPVLQRYYTVYDWGTKNIGFALARQPPRNNSIASESEAPPVVLA